METSTGQRTNVRRQNGCQRGIGVTRGGLGALLVLVGVLGLSCCNPTTQQATTNPDGIPTLTLHTAWTIDGLYPGFDEMTLSGSNVLIPDSQNYALESVDAATGAVAWRTPLPSLFPTSNPVQHGGDIFIFCIGSSASVQGMYFAWLKSDGTYMGSISVPSTDTSLTGGWVNGRPGFEYINLIGDAIFWDDNGNGTGTDNSTDIWKFDLTQPLTESAVGAYSGMNAMSIFYHIPGTGNMALERAGGGQILGFGSDVVFTYENYEAGFTYMVKPIDVVRLNATTGALVWNYQTEVAHNFGRHDLVPHGSDIIVQGTYGMELINATAPVSTGASWAFDSSGGNLFNPTISGNVIFDTSDKSATAVTAFSLNTGDQLWSLANGSSAGQVAQYYNGVLYVSEQEGVAAIDATKGQYIGRDNTLPGYSDQICNTIAYGNLFIFFSNELNPEGRIVAVNMGVSPL